MLDIKNAGTIDPISFSLNGVEGNLIDRVFVNPQKKYYQAGLHKMNFSGVNIGKVSSIQILVNGDDDIGSIKL